MFSPTLYTKCKGISFGEIEPFAGGEDGKIFSRGCVSYMQLFPCFNGRVHSMLAQSGVFKLSLRGRTTSNNLKGFIDVEKACFLWRSSNRKLPSRGLVVILRVQGLGREAFVDDEECVSRSCCRCCCPSPAELYVHSPSEFASCGLGGAPLLGGDRDVAGSHGI